MPSTNSLDLVDLSRRLKQEKLFVANERKEIEGLNRKVQLLSTGLLHQTWLTGQNRLALEDLSKGPLSSPFSSPFMAEQGGTELTENLELIQAQKYIPGRYMQSYVDLITLLRSHPEVVALCISTFEKEKSNLVRPPGAPILSVGDILQGVLNVYGGIGAPLLEDSTLQLKLLSSLAGLQLVGSEAPRRVLRQGSSAFSTLYKLISETVPSSRLFLVGALHQPITELLSSPDLQQIGSLVPVSPTGHADFSNGVNKDIASLDKTEKLAKLTKLFVDSILDNVHAFPSGLAWLIKSVHTQLSSSIPQKEVSKICNDLIWALFICPAVTNPEPFGVADTPVGSAARHTLSQVATILQSLALQPFDGTDPRLSEYVSYFEQDCLSSVLEHVLTTDSLPSEQAGIVSSLTRRTVLMPENLLGPFFTWLKECLILLEHNGKLTEIEIWPSLVKLTTAVSDTLPSLANSSSATTPKTTSNEIKPILLNSLSSITMSPGHAAANLFANGRKVLMNRKEQKPLGQGTPGDSRNEMPIAVIVFPLTHSSWEWIGMLPESEVASSSKQGKLLNGGPDADSLPSLEDHDAEERDDRSSIGEKRTRFSLSHDDGSVGTSDNLEVEAVSEAASTHSVSSSIEMEDQNDNLSDMLSANVSGRGTPNVSGRNTPLSIAEQEEGNANNDDNDMVMEEIRDGVAENPPLPQEHNPPHLPNLNLNNRPRPDPSKQARSEIEDKFCKFEIKKMLGGDETYSLVSDTWSTDVLASDSEMGGEAQQALNQLGQLNMGSRNSSVSAPPIIELPSALQDSNSNNDTMSEAWSTDVAASDIERLNDFDTDDTASVARSDDTGRSEGEALPYDTPRSSVSGSGSYRRQEEEQDLLMFDDVQPGPRRNTDTIARHPPTPRLGSDGAQSSIASIPVSSSVLDTPPTNNDSLLSDASSTPSQLNVSSANSLQTPGSSTRSNTAQKTITFDKTAERGDRENWDDENGRAKRFFRNLRNPFRGGRNRKVRGQDERYMDWDRMPENPSLAVPKLRKSLSEDVGSPANQASMNESSEEILAKYRRKPSLTENDCSIPSTSASSRDHNSGMKSTSSSTSSVIRKESLKLSRTDFITESRRKLRSVLSNCDLQLSQTADTSSIDTSMINLLRVEMATAVSRGDQVTAAHLQEAMRTVKQLGSEGCRKVLRLMRDDYRRRSEYISYLMRAKQGLLSTIQFLERATVKSKHEGDTYSLYLINECIRVWLEDPSQVALLEEFQKEFSSTSAMDEKIELLETFLYRLLDLYVGHKELTEWQLNRMENAIEQVVVSRVYNLALYPNGDADSHRDVVLQEHIAKLSGIITPSHKDLRIPKSRLGECPWPPAQRELKMLSAYKTPSDKLRCVVRTCSLIMNLSTERVVAADDFIPVLVFVIIKCNPPALLSTIQYVSSFCASKLTGEDQYWWTQFSSAVEFIKTMDYTE